MAEEGRQSFCIGIVLVGLVAKILFDVFSSDNKEEATRLGQKREKKSTKFSKLKNPICNKKTITGHAAFQDGPESIFVMLPCADIGS